jgi:hypothetical protein
VESLLLVFVDDEVVTGVAKGAEIAARDVAPVYKSQITRQDPAEAFSPPQATAQAIGPEAGARFLHCLALTPGALIARRPLTPSSLICLVVRRSVEHVATVSHTVCDL